MLGPTPGADETSFALTIVIRASFRLLKNPHKGSGAAIQPVERRFEARFAGNNLSIWRAWFESITMMSSVLLSAE
jgi:hypothetical protein